MTHLFATSLKTLTHGPIMPAVLATFERWHLSSWRTASTCLTLINRHLTGGTLSDIRSQSLISTVDRVRLPSLWFQRILLVGKGDMKGDCDCWWQVWGYMYTSLNSTNKGRERRDRYFIIHSEITISLDAWDDGLILLLPFYFPK